MLVDGKIEVLRAHGANVIEIRGCVPGNEGAGGNGEAAVVKPGGVSVRGSAARVAGEVGPLIEVGGAGAYARRGDRHTRAEISDDVRRPAAYDGIAYSAHVHGAPVAHRQVVRCLPGELILHVLRADRVLKLKILRILGAAQVRSHKSQRRITIVGHQLGPSETRQCGEVLRQPLL